jgi:hypothetical protein
MPPKKITKKSHSTISGNILTCENCKETHVVVLPIGLTEFCEILKSFEKLHKYCKKQ